MCHLGNSDKRRTMDWTFQCESCCCLIQQHNTNLLPGRHLWYVFIAFDFMFLFAVHLAGAGAQKQEKRTLNRFLVPKQTYP